MIVYNYLILVLFVPLVNLHILSKRQLDVSYGSPAYKYCVCGVKNKKNLESHRIIGGNETLGNEYPWMAAIVLDDKVPQLICGGSLISDQYVLSAAHCLRSKYSQSQMKVVLGEYNICLPDIRTVRFSIEKFIQHPKYKMSRHLLADIMLIKLNMRVTFNEYIRPVCLPKKVARQFNTEGQYGGKTGDILGWGIGDAFNASCILRKTSLIIYKPGTCSYAPFHTFCAGYLEGTRDACSGDSGGPFQIVNSESKYELIDCGNLNEDFAERIVGGELATPHLFPWIVAIFYEGDLHCGGALINNRYVLTAGHCIFEMNKKHLTVGLGLHDIEKTEEGLILPADELILHEQFYSDNVHDFNDIALIRLREPVRYTEDIRPICLPKANGSSYAGEEVKVAGWGRVKYNGDVSRYLQQASLKMMSYATCRKSKVGTHIERSMICAYADNTDACQGDSGGPLLYQRENGKFETIGVVSWGIECAKKGYPGVYVKNTDYLNWIYSHTTDATYCMDK